MKISPAPWIAECVGSTGHENPEDVYELNNGYKRIAEYLTEADAKLCAAAPDLLAQCEGQAELQAKIFGYLNSYAKGEHMSDQARIDPQGVLAQVYADLAAELAPLRAAIAKAKEGK